MKIEKQTRSLLKRTGLTPEFIASKTKLKMRWIYDFRNDVLNDYGIRKVQLLNDHLRKSVKCVACNGQCELVIYYGKDVTGVIEVCKSCDGTGEQIK